MFQPRKSTLAVLIMIATAVFPGCHPKAKQQPVTVRIFRDLDSPYARELDHRILEFQETNPRTQSGAVIAVQTYQSSHYENFLQEHLNRDVTLEVVILNSPKDAGSNPSVQAELAHAVNICAAVRACPDDVPAYVSSRFKGVSAEAGQLLLAFLQKPPA